MSRTCTECGVPVGGSSASSDPRFHDPCIRELPGVTYACCGHGEGFWHEDKDEPYYHTQVYVVFEDGTALYGRAAKAAMEMLGGNPPPLPEGRIMRAGRTVRGPGWSIRQRPTEK